MHAQFLVAEVYEKASCASGGRENAPLFVLPIFPRPILLRIANSSFRMRNSSTMEGSLGEAQGHAAFLLPLP